MAILICGGTRDAIIATPQITEFFKQQNLHIPCIYSLAGVTQNPNVPDGVMVHSGGFGGMQGLIEYIVHHDVQAVFDFTHPYATQISTHIHQALCRLSLHIPLYQYNRPAWKQDSYIQYMDTVSDIADATRHIQGTLFVALGAKDAPLFFDHQGRIVVRSMRNIHIPNGTCIVAPPPQSRADEQRLFDVHDFKAVICKDSGTENGYHKIAIAKQLHIPAHILSRPHISGTVLYNKSYIFTDIKTTIDTFKNHIVNVM